MLFRFALLIDPLDDLGREHEFLRGNMPLFSPDERGIFFQVHPERKPDGIHAQNRSGMLSTEDVVLMMFTNKRRHPGMVSGVWVMDLMGFLQKLSQMCG